MAPVSDIGHGRNSTGKRDCYPVGGFIVSSVGAFAESGAIQGDRTSCISDGGFLLVIRRQCVGGG
jgi:hypothetical protein